MKIRFNMLFCAIISIMLFTTVLSGSALAITYEQRLNFNKAWQDNDLSEEALEYYRRPRGWDSRRDGFEDPVALAREITKGLDSDYEKAKAIHDWVCGNISYDKDKFYAIERHEDSPYLDILVSRRGVCADYTTLTIVMLRGVDIPARRVRSFIGEGEAFWGSKVLDHNYKLIETRHEDVHDHTEAYIDGRWLSMDTTWDAAGEWENGRQTVPAGIRGYEWFDIPLEKLSEGRMTFDLDHFYGVAIYDTMLMRYGGSLGDYAIPDGITEILQGAGWFYATYNVKNPLSKLSIPGSVKNIRSGTFNSALWRTPSLIEVTIAEGTEAIEDLAFFGCTELRKITIPKSVAHIGERAFADCKKLTIHGKKGSAAEAYAKKQKIKFIAVK